MTSSWTRRCSRRCSPFPDPTTAWDFFSADDLYKRHTLQTDVLQILEVVSAEPAAAAYATDAFIDGASARAALPLAEETAKTMTPGNLLPGCTSTMSTGASSASTRTAAREAAPPPGVRVRDRLGHAADRQPHQ